MTCDDDASSGEMVDTHMCNIMMHLQINVTVYEKIFPATGKKITKDRNLIVSNI